MKRVAYISGQEIFVYINISTIEVMWKKPRDRIYVDAVEGTEYKLHSVKNNTGLKSMGHYSVGSESETRKGTEWFLGRGLREKEIRTQMGKSLLTCMEHLGLLTCSQNIIPFGPNKNWLNPVHLFAVFYINFDIIFTFTFWSPKYSLLLGCSNHSFV